MDLFVIYAALSLIGLLLFSELSAASFRRLAPFLEAYARNVATDGDPKRGWEKLALVSWAFAATVPLLAFCLCVIFFMDHQVHSSRSFILGAVIGSNVLSLGLLFGLILFSSPLSFFRIRTMNSPVFLFLGTLAFLITCLDNKISALEGIFLLILALAYAVYVRAFSTEWKFHQKLSNDAAEEVAGGILSVVSIFCLAFGFLLFAILVAWPFASWLSVFGAKNQVSSVILGVHVIATILCFPWLVRTLFTLGSSDSQKARSISGITHSGILNVLLLPGFLALFQPLEVHPAMLGIDLPVLLFFTGLFVSTLMIEKQEGRALPAFILVAYLAYVGSGALR